MTTTTMLLRVTIYNYMTNDEMTTMMMIWWYLFIN